MKLKNQKIKTWGIRLLDHRWYSWNAFLAAAAQRLRLRGASRLPPQPPPLRGGGQKSVSWNHLWSRSRNLRFQFIWFSSFMKPPKVSSFHAKIVVKPSKISKQVNETRSQKKKMRGFYLKPHFFLKRDKKLVFLRKNKWMKNYENVKNCDRRSKKIMKLEKRKKEKIISQKFKLPVLHSNCNEETTVKKF